MVAGVGFEPTTSGLWARRAASALPRDKVVGGSYPNLAIWSRFRYPFVRAAVAELVDARDSKSRDRKVMRVRFSPAAPPKNDPHRVVFLFIEKV